MKMLEPSPRKFPNRKRPVRDPVPRFKAEETNQLDFVRGCFEAQVPKDHLARQVVDLIDKLDVSSTEAKYSSLGRRGYHPRHVLGVLVYGSLVGLHESTKLAKALKTDAALRLAAGGHAISEGRLRAFRRENEQLMVLANRQILKLAAERGMLDGAHLATDSVRLRAHASTKSVRTLKRSKERLDQLAAVDTTTLDAAGQQRHEEKVEKHRQAVSHCERTGQTNFVTTNPSAGLLKFPTGAAAPGHRVTMTAAGVRERLIVDVLIDADSHDFGKLEGSMRRTRELFQSIGVSVDNMQVAADAGYWSEKDLAFAAETKWVDVLIAERQTTYRGNDELHPLFPPHAFTLRDDGKAVCPAGTQMEGPFRDGRAERFHGVGCTSCPLKSKCTKGKRKYLTIDAKNLHLRAAMNQRMNQPGAKQRYNERIATIEPVFSSIQHAMGFRRLSARHEKSIRAEVLLKVVAHNASRLLAAARKSLCVRVWISWISDQRGADVA